MTFNWYPFSKLSLSQLYAILWLRAQVFVVEQRCVYLDPDGKDDSAIHLLVEDHGSLVGYLRLFPVVENNIVIHFGRVVSAHAVRHQGVGKQLLGELMAYCALNFPGIAIECSAQSHLVKFYELFGLKTVGEIYSEDGIPHIKMTTKLDSQSNTLLIE